MKTKSYQRIIDRPIECEELTDRQRHLLRVFADMVAETGSPPTVRQLAARLKIKSPNGVMVHMHSLARKGHVLPPDQEAGRLCWSLSPKAELMLRGVSGRWPYVTVRLLAPEVSMLPFEARELARQLVEAADRVEGGQ